MARNLVQRGLFGVDDGAANRPDSGTLRDVGADTGAPKFERPPRDREVAPSPLDHIRKRRALAAERPLSPEGLRVVLYARPVCWWCLRTFFRDPAVPADEAAQCCERAECLTAYADYRRAQGWPPAVDHGRARRERLERQVEEQFQPLPERPVEVVRDARLT